MSAPKLRVRGHSLNADIPVEVTAGSDRIGNGLLCLTVELLPGTDVAGTYQSCAVTDEHPEGRRWLTLGLDEPVKVVILIQPSGLAELALRAQKSKGRKARDGCIEARSVVSRPRLAVKR